MNWEKYFFACASMWNVGAEITHRQIPVQSKQPILWVAYYGMQGTDKLSITVPYPNANVQNRK